MTDEQASRAKINRLERRAQSFHDLANEAEALAMGRGMNMSNYWRTMRRVERFRSQAAYLRDSARRERETLRKNNESR